MHDPFECVDGLLAAFAFDLTARGFRVLSYVQVPRPDAGGSPLYLDLATGMPLPSEPGAAEAFLRRAVAQSAELLLIGRFSACTAATDRVGAPIGGRVKRSADVTAGGAQNAGRARDRVKTLSEAVGRIRGITGLIGRIAGKTNLLALNATMEAVHAGPVAPLTARSCPAAALPASLRRPERGGKDASGADRGVSSAAVPHGAPA